VSDALRPGEQMGDFLRGLLQVAQPGLAGSSTATEPAEVGRRGLHLHGRHDMPGPRTGFRVGRRVG
jgi:hypothetical protein